MGEFTLDPGMPWYYDDAPETNDGPIRQVIVFRLRPVDAVSPDPSESTLAPAGADAVSNVQLEEQYTERTFTDPGREPYESERREASLVRAYAEWLRAAGTDVCRLMIVPEGERKPLFTDLWDGHRNELVEAKGTASREAVRMAIGQLADYARFLSGEPARAILLPTKPRKDLLRLAAAADVRVIWRGPDGTFERVAPNPLRDH
jgi:hypothetical protein